MYNINMATKNQQLKPLAWHTESRKINDLVPYEHNPRLMTEKQAADLQKSLERLNLMSIPVIDIDNKIISGHQRVKILQLLNRGEETIDVRVPNRKLTDAEFREANLRENKNLGEWDLDELADWNIDELRNVGWEEEELNDIFQLDVPGGEGNGDPDDVPDPPAEPKSKLGDLYQLGRHRLLCGDSTKKEDVERLMGGVKADMVFTDPPYEVSYTDKNSFLNEIGKGNCNQREIINDHQSEKDIQSFWKAAFEIIRDNLAEINSYYITGPQIQGMMMMMMMMQEAGLPYRHVIIWVKNNHVLGRCDYNYKHEPIFFGWTTRHKFYGNGEMKTSVWEVDKPLKNDLHPTMKPITLMINALLNSTEIGQICFDPFGGSGSTLIACEKINRRCFMAEIDPIYIDIIITRWETFTGQKAEKL